MIIALEGIDGCGKKTQIKLIKKHLKAKKIAFSSLKTPNYNNPVGKAIKKYLNGDLLLEPEEAFLLYATDVLMMIRDISDLEKKSKIVLLDRYITSTIAYQCARGLSFNKALKIIEDLKFPKIDKIIYIDIKPETSIERKKKEKGTLDVHERNTDYLGKVRRFYLREINEKVLGDWVAIDGKRSVKKIKEDILNEIKL
jgi:dTMP kinase